MGRGGLNARTACSARPTFEMHLLVMRSSAMEVRGWETVGLVSAACSPREVHAVPLDLEILVVW
jgi:hypothetical protein